ncbi:MAG: hypothetical protein GY765_06605 [bacterium]|nr:hypothetical protein [bacterium]
MLRTMRDDFKKYSWMLWLVIISFVLGFSLIDMFSGKPRAEGDLIFVGDTVIRGEEYQEQLLNMLRTYKERFKENFNNNLITQLRIPDQILQSMITSTIIRLESEKMNITASEDEVREKITKIPGLQKDGQFVGAKSYKMALARNKIQIADFEKNIRKEIVHNKFKELVSGGIVIDKDSLKEKFIKDKDNAQVDYILLTPNRIKENPEVTDAEISTHYDANKENYKSTERRSGCVVALKFDDYKKDIKVERQELYDYFKTNMAQFIEPEKTKVSRILLKYTAKDKDAVYAKAEKLQKELTKENFAEKAKLVSQDDKAKTGGDHGYWGWQRFTKQEKTIINSLSADEISSPVVTPGGYSILFLSEKQKQKQKEFDKVKDIIKGTLEKERLNKVVENKLNEIYTKVKSAADLKAKAAELKVQTVETEPMTRGGSVKDIQDNGYISRKLFELNDKEISPLLTFPKGMAFVQLTKIEKPTVEALDKVKEKVKKDVAQVKKVELVLKEAKEVSAKLNELEKDEDIAKFLKEKDLNPTDFTYKRGNRLAHHPEQDGLDAIVFSLEEKKYSAPIKFKNDVALVKLKTKKITSDEEFDKEKEKYYAQKLNEMKNSYFTSYIANKKESYDIRINQELFDKIKDYIIKRFK